jgi:hypothetical protein
LRRRWTTGPPFVAIAASRGAKAVIAHALDKALFDEITAQLKTKAIRVKTGTLVDATIIASASQEDREATLGQAQGTGGGPWVQGSCGRRRQHGSDRASRDPRPMSMMARVAPMLCRTNRPRCSPTALIGARFSERPFASREAPCASQQPACGAAMKPKHGRALKPGISRSTAFAAASRRSLERGSAATAFGARDGEGCQRPVCRFASAQLSTTSSDQLRHLGPPPARTWAPAHPDRTAGNNDPRTCLMSPSSARGVTANGNRIWWLCREMGQLLRSPRPAMLCVFRCKP